MKKKYQYARLFLLCIGLFSCEKIVQDLNTNPNNPTDASASLILTGAQMANITVHEGHTARVAGMFSGYFTGTDRQYKDLNNYNVTGSSFDQTWQNIYYGVLEQTNLVIEKSQVVNNRLVIGIAKIIQAHAIGTAAVCWGDVPFPQAGKITQFPDPMFEKQADVYAQVQTMLDEAIADLASGIGTSPGKADIHFGASVTGTLTTVPVLATKWTQVAHTLKARFYLDVRNYAAAYSEAQVGINSSANSMLAPHGNVQNANENMMYAFIARNRVGDMNAQGTLLTKLLDPAPANAAYKGNAKTDEKARQNFYFLNVNGGAAAIIPNTGSSPLRGIFAQTASFPLVSYEENLLILAEAGVRSQGFIEGLAKLNVFRAYMDGGGYIDPTYRTAFTFNYDAYDIIDFLPIGMVNPDGISQEDALLREILRERYVTFFGQKLGFNDLRRTRKETVVSVKPTPNAGTVLPERFIYSQNEVNSNNNAPNPVPGVFVPTPLNQ